MLKRVLPPRGLVLEIASGSGEHAAYFAAHLSALTWQPTDPDPQALASIAAHGAASGAPNLLPPLQLDVTAQAWPVERADAVMCANMIHIAPWAACEGLIAGTQRVLPAGGILYLYGPSRSTAATPRQTRTDRYLRAQNAACGIRDLADVTALAEPSLLWRSSKPCRCRPIISALFSGAAPDAKRHAAPAARGADRPGVCSRIRSAGAACPS